MFPALLHAVTVFGSALLLFLIQPMMGKLLLPLFGGAAGVWATAMLFFQVLLLLGYLYAWGLARFAPAAQIAIHALLLAASCLLLPVAARAPLAGGAPEWRILTLLAASVGLPYFLLASTSPLVQSWRAPLAGHARVYRLYAVSNLASLAALMLYPIVIEPLLPVHRQMSLWSIGYVGCFVPLAAASAWSGRRNAALARTPAPPVAASARLLWIALAACPSVLWLAMANTLSQNVAPVPLLWVLPLAVYLLSLVLAFEGDRWYRPAFFRIALPVSWLVMGYGLVRQGPAIGLRWQIAAFLLALGVCCLYCHGELARRKPPSAGLTSFYVFVAFGGALGGLFVALVAPHLFDQFLEFPIAVAGCVILAMALLYRLPARRVARLAVVGAAAMLLAVQMNDWQEHTRVRRRNFYGSLQVSDIGEGDTALRVLASGAIQHGSQFAGAAQGRRATTYYGPASGVARAIQTLAAHPLRAALIGLGAGTLAVYARPGDLYRFYELNPQVIALARGQFRYLRESAGQIEIVQGDGRLALAADPGPPFDLIVLDAFSGDSIPAHLLTREAFTLYFAHLKPDGILAVHLTNRYVDLEGVVRGSAQAAGRHTLMIQSPGDPAAATHEALWALITSNRDAIARLQPLARPPSAPPRFWTDDYSDLWSVLR